jgi:hypothetical protein
MKNRLKLLFLSALILVLGGCNNLSETFAPKPTYSETEISNFNINKETQIFAAGNSTVTESGVAVAKMRAREDAEKELKKQIYNETKNVLTSFFDEVHTKNFTVSSKTVEDLATLVSAQLTKEATIANSWNDQGKEYIVLAIDKNRIPEKVKEIFVVHLEGIVAALNNAINKISTEYAEIAKPKITEESKKGEENSKNVDLPIEEKNKNTEVISEEVNPSEDANSEEEVNLDEF